MDDDIAEVELPTEFLAVRLLAIVCRVDSPKCRLPSDMRLDRREGIPKVQ